MNYKNFSDMSKIYYCFSFLILELGMTCCTNEQLEVKEPHNIELGLVPLADPFILVEGDTYYAYGTSSDDGIVVCKSKDLKKWTYAGLALNKDDSYGTKWFWAPEVYKIGEKYLMYYSSEEYICAATSDSPTGPFVQEEKKPMLSERAIDNTLFIDDDGIPYIFYVQADGGNHVLMAELEKDYKTIKMNTIRECIHVSQNWEDKAERVNEGPFVIKHNGIYYMTYSANAYWNPLYGIGCATTTNLKKGEWVKYPSNPILQKPGNLVGTGHHALFTDKDGVNRIVFHAHHDDLKVQPRCMYISTYFFQKGSNGIDSLIISPDYMIPEMYKE